MISGNTLALIGLALIGAPLFGALLRGADRILTARIQGRIGPPLLQPVYDIVKLFQKTPVVVNRAQIVYAFLHLAFLALATLMLVLGRDGIMFLFVLAMSTLALILGGMCVRSPFSRIGSQREILLLVAYEPILILMFIGFYLANGSFRIQQIYDRPEPLLLSLPLLFLAYLLVVGIKLQKSPFDLATSHHAHQEIVKGVTLEFAGPFLGLIELAHCYETALFIGMAGLFWGSNPWAASALMAAAFLLAVAADNLFARLTTLWVFRFLWTGGFLLALTNLLWLYR